MKPEDEQYFDRLEAELDRAMAIAEEAKSRGEDPEPEVEIPTARDMADRVENILGIEGVAERVRELEDDFSREEAALELVEDFVEGRVGSYESDAGKIEGAVRTAVALLTEGVVAAPIEGIDRVEIDQNDDGTDYVTVAYAGPIRSAGGTAQALSVLVADYARSLLDVGEFKPRDDEIERYAEEIELYSNETGLQYTPKDKESKFITEHCPVMLDGEATSDEEVSGFRDLERIDTNSARGGMCLVLAEGIALKAPKIQRYTRNLDEVEWPWLQDLIDGTIGKNDGDEEADEAESGDSASEEETANAEDEEGDAHADGPDGPPRIDENGKFLRDLIAGRPVFGHPSESGGFRLRYGRSRNLGDATAGVHPATMRLVDDFLAPGTQIKTELPGKAAGVVPVDSIEGPTVRLANGDVRRIADDAEAKEVRNGVEAILDLGEYLVNYGEFVENNHPLAPAAYATEWWAQDLEAAGVDVQALEDDPAVDLADPDPETAIEWAEEFDAPLHPAYTYVWHDVSVGDVDRLADAVAVGEVRSPDAGPGDAVADGGTAATAPTDGTTGNDTELVLEFDPEVARTLETLLVPHRQRDDDIFVPAWRPLAASLGLDEDRQRPWTLDDLPSEAREWEDGNNAVKAVDAVAPFEIREKAPTRVGCRMGRPEKSESRELSPAVHTLFPIGNAGGDQRDVGAATHHADSLSETPGEVAVEIGVRKCHDCDVETHEPRCPDCGEHIEPHYTCPECDTVLEPDDAGRVQCDRCEVEGSAVEERRIDVGEAYHDAMDAVGEREHAFDMLKGVKGLTSRLKTPEPIEKGVLRAKHGVSAFKDGTVRYDMTDLPVTAVKPAELDVSVDQFRQLGYEEDVHGDDLRHEDQVVELKVQDVILSEGGAEHMLKTADFVDDLLESYYGLDPYYELEDNDDLVGELVFGMAPHTSAAVVGRVIGFTNVAGGYAHPYFHAAKRRNCDGDEDCVMLLLDGLLNFSKSYLPDQRGGRMDAPLVMSSRIDPQEIDDEAHNVDVVTEYPREFYEATRELADPEDVDVEIVEDTLGTDEEYSGFGFTHDTTDIAAGPDLSAYKTLDSMMDKMNAQLELARTLRAVDETDVAERVIEYHFLPDLIGNLRAFSRQEVRCLDCGEKFRRAPLSRDCRECGGDITLTVHEGSVNKYMETAMEVAEEYGARKYTKQRLEVLDRSIARVFENDKNKASSLDDFM
ncbi:DNA polymerase II large subunit [Salinarchaeum sp. Harcht-Bsk1]|uniref:DNA polymerase II large subunit n=1 Tax=Salinarchaeum sp. Harcht-Bsk1 TaxID=1333523 RepID=UPI0003424584|nr:DNA polymerase II large subunit [Salinarchaeum sp. Harcht-Bsk1]AGN01620.1 DNA polymerase II large subunit [Salinarchaeum sp. Harcht-Bsk1]